MGGLSSSKIGSDYLITLANYALGNATSDELPIAAIRALEDGYDTPSLRILAWLENPWEIDVCLKRVAEESGVKIPSKKEAAIILINRYTQLIIDQVIEPIEGLYHIIYDVLRKTDCFGTDHKYIYDRIAFHTLYGLYDSYDDMNNPSMLFSEAQRTQGIKEIKQQVPVEARTFQAEFNRLVSGTSDPR